MNQAPREQEPKGTASFRSNPSFIKFLILAEGLQDKSYCKTILVRHIGKCLTVHTYT